MQKNLSAEAGTCLSDAYIHKDDTYYAQVYVYTV